MALVFSLHVGEDFYVRDTQYRIAQNFRGPDFMVERVCDGQTFHITNRRSTQLEPDVNVSAGRRSEHSTARLSIEAPREIRIMRGENYRENHGVGYEPVS